MSSIGHVLEKIFCEVREVRCQGILLPETYYHSCHPAAETLDRMFRMRGDVELQVELVLERAGMNDAVANGERQV